MREGFVQVGIDHGTSNSSIAYIEGDRPRVLKVDGVSEVMPSAVYIDRHGREFVGRQAIEAIAQNADESEGGGHVEYKPYIGQDNRYDFKAARVVLSGPELGARVIRKLLRAYEEAGNAPPKAAVITVPAKFDQSACEGTRKAAELAGLLFAPQIHEPIAAALAYGFSSEERRAQWMVFDLGGGTLDISLVIVRGGKIAVAESGNAGDNLLGGSYFDRALFEVVKGELARRYSLAGFTKSNHRYRNAWNRLKLAVEGAKIRLSSKPETVVTVDGALCKDEAGREVEVEVPVTRRDYERLIAPDVEKAVQLCEMLLKSNRMTSRDVDRLILVGGPTKTPYIQNALRERLGIPFDTTVDPMTAVSQGAALHATTVPLPGDVRARLASALPPAEVAVRLEYERHSKQPVANLAGKVEQGGGDGWSVEVRRTDGGWSSGTLPIPAGGIFSFALRLVERGAPALSRFRTTVRGPGGKSATLEEPEIWHPYPSITPRLSNSIRVAVQENGTAVLLAKDAELPARGRQSFRTTKPLIRGSGDQVIEIPVLEGVTHLLGTEDDHADCSFHMGTLTIKGDDQRVSRDLPRGSKIEITIHQDESRAIRAIAYVPLLEQEFDATFAGEGFGTTLDEVGRRFEALRERLQAVTSLQERRPVPEVGESLERVGRMDVLKGIEDALKRAREGEGEAQHRAYKRCLELAGALNALEEMQRRVRVAETIENLRPAAEGHEKESLAAIEKDVAAADAKELPALERSLNELNGQVRHRPFGDVMVDLYAISGQNVSPEQHRIFKEADELAGRILARNKGTDGATPAELKELARLHEALLRAYPDLQEKRMRVLEELRAKGMDAASLRTDIAKE